MKIKGKVFSAAVIFVLFLTGGCGRAVETAKWTEAQTQPSETPESAGGSEALSEAETEAPETGESTEEGPGPQEGADEGIGGGTESEDGETPYGQLWDKGDRPKVRGIYVTGAMAGTSNMDRLIDLVDRTELNALVIDVKNDEGRVVCDIDAPLANEIGAVRRYVKDMPALIEKCKEKDIYLIARIVTFRDPFLAEAMPEWSLHRTDGSIFRDKDGLAWVNPYETEMWDYVLEIARGAVELGFDEIQFDYIRFSTDTGMKQVDFGEEAQYSTKEDVITDFAAYMADELHAMGAAVSADVYGVVIDSGQDQQIVGQNYCRLAEHVDYLSPMVYPSHYGPYNYNIPVPDAQPYDTVLSAMQASRKVLSGLDPKTKGASVSGNSPDGGQISGNDAAPFTPEEIAALPPKDGLRADVRPWLQDFTATWVKGHIQYGPQQIREQIQAVYDAGYEEWILWNAANRYTEGGLYGPDGQPVKEGG